jgi:CubicO group peptidase (beta-lactamase class C family)
LSFKQTIGGLALAIAGLAAQAQTIDRARLDRLFDALSKHEQAMGSLAVAVPGQPVYLRAIGRANVQQAQATPETRYRIGSVSKVFTAALVMQLVDEGRLSLDTPLASFFPAFPNAQRITIAHLLGHRSGLADVKDLPDFDRWARTPRSLDDLRVALQGQAPKSEPGARADYNNSGYLLLWWIVERVTGMDYGTALQQRIAAPLGLSGTSYRADPAADPLASVSYGWRDDRLRWEATPETHASVPGGAGAVVSTPRDLVVFMQALFDHKVVSARSLSQMTTVVDGLGRGLHPVPPDVAGAGRQGFGHEGLIDGHQAVLLILPREGVVLAYCANGVRQPRDAIVASVLRTLFEPGYRAPGFEPVTTTIDFALDLGPSPDPRVEAASIGVRGSAPPLSWQRTLPLARDPADGLFKARVAVTLPEGTALEYKFVQGPGPTWERDPNRRLEPAPGAATARVNALWNVSAERQAMREQVLAADARLFDAFNRQDADTMAAVFSPRLEFFHDVGGLAGHEQTMRQLRENFARGMKLRRVLIPASTEVLPIADWGAMQFGAHDFCRREGEREVCQRLRFANVWEKTPSGWQALRVLSYDH